HAPPRLAALQADGERLLDVVALQQALREDARRVEADDAGKVRRAERLRRGEEVDGLDEVRLPLAVAADDEVRRRMERHFLGGEIAEVLCGEAAENHDLSPRARARGLGGCAARSGCFGAPPTPPAPSL